MNAGGNSDYGQQRQQTDGDCVLSGSGCFQPPFLRKYSCQDIVHLSPLRKYELLFMPTFLRKMANYRYFF
jgi:hypothetical protein